MNNKEYKNKVKIVIKVIFLCFVAFILYIFNIQKNQEQNTAPTEIEAQPASYVNPTKTLRQNLLESGEICNAKHIAANGEYEACLSEQIKNKSEEDFVVFNGINKYCNNKTTNEADRRECIDEVIGL